MHGRVFADEGSLPALPARGRTETESSQVSERFFPVTCLQARSFARIGALADVYSLAHVAWSLIALDLQDLCGHLVQSFTHTRPSS